MRPQLGGAQIEILLGDGGERALGSCDSRLLLLALCVDRVDALRDLEHGVACQLACLGDPETGLQRELARRAGDGVAVSNDPRLRPGRLDREPQPALMAVADLIRLGFRLGVSDLELGQAST